MSDLVGAPASHLSRPLVHLLCRCGILHLAGPRDVCPPTKTSLPSSPSVETRSGHGPRAGHALFRLGVHAESIWLGKHISVAAALSTITLSAISSSLKCVSAQLSFEL